jgi:hypothetical protein
MRKNKTDELDKIIKELSDEGELIVDRVLLGGRKR